MRASGRPLLERRAPSGEPMKKTYERPAVVHTEKLEARAVTCTKADAETCTAPIQS